MFLNQAEIQEIFYLLMYNNNSDFQIVRKFNTT